MKGKITRVWLSMVTVSDLDKALTFYSEILGLPIALDARAFNHIEVGPHEPLAKIGIESTGKQSKRRKWTGIVLDTDDIYALYERLTKKGVTFTLKPTKMPWGGIVANFLDSDKNELQVVQDPEHYTRE
ncbi:MAG: VOC family protein [Candidatus Bathyarchaeota archaeon]|nr:VOC family protein [Candidatus Bathyarchaeota archaeon]